MDMHTLSSIAGGLDLKSMALGAVVLKLAEPYLVKALVAGLPKAVEWTLEMAEKNPAAAQILAEYRDDFAKAFDAADAAAKKALPPAPPNPPETPKAA